MVAATEAPAVVTAPKLAGSGEIGTAVSVDAGTWSGRPAPTIALQWRRDGAAIVGVTGASYVLQAADAGHEVSVLVTARNSSGSVSVSSNTIPVGLDATPPTNTVLPTTSGTPTQGRTLTATSNGPWSGTPAPTFARRWQRNGTDIAGQTGSTYVLQAADVNAQIRLRVIATNTAGAASAYSAAVLVRSASDDFNIVSLNPSNYLALLAQARTGKTRYVFAPGTYPDFFWPTNVTDFDIELVPSDRTDPPVFRGMGWVKPGNVKGNFTHLANAAAGSDFNKNIKIDGLDFRAERFTSMQRRVGTGVQSLVLTDGQGLGWRVTGTSHPSGDLVGDKENGGITLLDINGGNGVYEITNCLFDGAAIQIGWSGNGSMNFHHNILQNLCEDGFKYGSGNFTFTDNEINAKRGPTTAMSDASGGPPPHEDGIQSNGGGLNNYRVMRNVIITTGEYGGLNGGQLRPNSNFGSSTPHYNVRIEDNEVRSPTASAFILFGYAQNGTGADGTGYDIIVRGNKCWSGGLPWESSPAILGKTGTAEWGNGRRLFTNNVAGKCNLGDAPGNIDSNSRNTVPTGWSWKYRLDVTPGTAFSGRYGATGGVIP